jgi:hypothetical protein
MRGKKKKSIKELETELEQLIANSGRSEDDIHNDYIAYCALKRKIDNPDSRHNDDDIRQMNDLNDVFLLGNQAMSLLWMFPVTETVSFMHASPNSRIAQLLRLNKQVL